MAIEVRVSAPRISYYMAMVENDLVNDLVKGKNILKIFLNFFEFFSEVITNNLLKAYLNYFS